MPDIVETFLVDKIVCKALLLHHCDKVVFHRIVHSWDK